MTDVETLLRSVERGIGRHLNLMRKPENYGVSNEGVAYHVLVGIALALNSAANDLSEQTAKVQTTVKTT